CMLKPIVRVQLWITRVQIAARIVQRFGPSEPPKELPAASEAALVLRLQGVVSGVAVSVLHIDAAKIREEPAGWQRVVNAKKLLVGIKIPHKILAAIGHVRNAGEAAVIQLPLDLQVPLADAGSRVAGKHSDHADAGGIIQIQSREVTGRQRTGGVCRDELR